MKKKTEVRWDRAGAGKQVERRMCFSAGSLCWTSVSAKGKKGHCSFITWAGICVNASTSQSSTNTTQTCPDVNVKKHLQLHTLTVGGRMYGCSKDEFKSWAEIIFFWLFITTGLQGRKKWCSSTCIMKLFWSELLNLPTVQQSWLIIPKLIRGLDVETFWLLLTHILVVCCVGMLMMVKYRSPVDVLEGARKWRDHPALLPPSPSETLGGVIIWEWREKRSLCKYRLNPRQTLVSACDAACTSKTPRLTFL